MKLSILTISFLSLVSCTFSGSYISPAQNFKWETSIVVPVDDYQK